MPKRTVYARPLPIQRLTSAGSPAGRDVKLRGLKMSQVAQLSTKGFDSGFKGLYFIYEQAMQAVFVVVFVGQGGHELLSLGRAAQFPGQFAQGGDTHAEYGFRRDCGDKARLEPAVFGVGNSL